MGRKETVQLVARRLRALREARGLSRARLAERAGISERYLGLLEKGEANVSLGLLLRVLRALEVTPLELFAHGGSGGDELATLLAGLTARERHELVSVVRRWLEARRARLRGVALVGLRGAGKTTLGRALAEATGVPFRRLSAEVERLAGMRVDELFALGGEEAYRRFEREALEGLVAGGGRMVLETAGGIVHNPEAFEILLRHFRTVWLTATPEDHLERVRAQGDTRPMRGFDRAREHVARLLETRAPLYGRADHRLDTSGRPVRACLEELLALAAPVLSADERQSGHASEVLSTES